MSCEYSILLRAPPKKYICTETPCVRSFQLPICVVARLLPSQWLDPHVKSVFWSWSQFCWLNPHVCSLNTHADQQNVHVFLNQLSCAESCSHVIFSVVSHHFLPATCVDSACGSRHPWSNPRAAAGSSSALVIFLDVEPPNGSFNG